MCVHDVYESIDIFSDHLVAATVETQPLLKTMLFPCFRLMRGVYRGRTPQQVVPRWTMMMDQLLSVPVTIEESTMGFFRKNPPEMTVI